QAMIAGLMSDPECAQWTRLFYHLSTADLDSESDASLLSLVRSIERGLSTTFVFDRPRMPLQVCEGVDRASPAALIAIGLGLPRLLDQLGSRRDAETFIGKLGSLARLALNAAAQKRDFLKKQNSSPEFHRGFLIDRARTVIVPVGLGTVSHA